MATDITCTYDSGWSSVKDPRYGKFVRYLSFASGSGGLAALTLSGAYQYGVFNLSTGLNPSGQALGLVMPRAAAAAGAVSACTIAEITGSVTLMGSTDTTIFNASSTAAGVDPATYISVPLGQPVSYLQGMATGAAPNVLVALPGFAIPRASVVPATANYSQPVLVVEWVVRGANGAAVPLVSPLPLANAGTYQFIVNLVVLSSVGI